MKKDSKINWFKTHKKAAWAIGIFIAAYSALCFAPFVASYAQYPLHVVRCVGLPITSLKKGIYEVYMLPGDTSYGPSSFYPGEYFCSETEAQAAGYRHSTERY